MARPKKATVDYFPHACSHKTTIFVLEQKYGNDGYAFWFKLLELLASTEGHYYDCNKVHKWEFLQAITHLSEDKCLEILELLAKLEAIDPELWAQRIIWSDNFVAGIADVYRNRRVETPAKPNFYKQKPHNKDISTPKSTQTKLKETKVNKNRRIFEKPTVEDIQRYCRERSNHVDAEQFYNFYESKGWMIGKNKMKDWRAAIRTWEKRPDNKSKRLSPTLLPIDKITNLDKAKRLLEAERTTTAMIRCLTELSDDDRKELTQWILDQGSYLKPVYKNARKILKERTARGKA